ncbi:ATP-grasp domain-containing protein [Peribacillus sp. SCS-155]|uniref:ATP-grasp domain-containing protein n=1 Tax=Peribacillus sedimenti TaxID=3115297 RepID=UPI003905DEC5
MRTIVFIGIQKSGSSRDAVLAARKLGFYTVVFTNQKKHLAERVEFPDVDLMVFADLKDLEWMREKIEELQGMGNIIETVVSFVDPNVTSAAFLCKHFCDINVSVKAISTMENKIETRNTLRGTEFGINYGIYDERDNLNSVLKKNNLHYPVIIKSPGSTGSKAVFVAENELELKNHMEKLRKKSIDSTILFEEYIEGPQYLVEVLVYNNNVHVVAVIEQEITKGERFIITGYSLLAQVPKELYDSLLHTVQSILDELQFTDGSCHFELRRQQDKWKIVEINPRISGAAMNRMIQVAYGINLVEQIIRLWLGEEPCLIHQHEQSVFTQYITLSEKGILQKVTGKESALKYEGVTDVFIKPRKGAYLHPPLSMGHRYAYVMAAASDITDAKKIAKAAAGEISFHLN